MEPSQAQNRKNRMNKIRSSLQLNPSIKTNTLKVQAKIEKRKKRKTSLLINPDEQLTRSQQQILNEYQNQVRAMCKFSQKYEMGDKIGQGSNGLVRKCYLKSSRQLFAVKKIMMDEQHILFLKKNFKDIRELDHPNIIKYREMYLDLTKNVCYLVMDFVTMPNLQEIKLQKQSGIKLVMYQLFSTLEYIHEKGICHRDIKPQNILYDQQKRTIKVIDFGISKKIKQRGEKREMLTITGTPYFRAPQMFNGGGYDQKVDVWAAGVTLYHLITKVTPFESEYHSTTIDNILKGEVYYDEALWNKYDKFAKDLVIRLLKPRKERLSAAEACRHFWFDQQAFRLTDITKSDMPMLKLSLGSYSKDTDESNSAFQRSLTNRKTDFDGKIMQNKQNQKIQATSLRKWIMGNEDDDYVIQINSETEQQYLASPKANIGKI